MCEVNLFIQHIDPSSAHTQFVKFTEREEGNTPYHRQYDFLIHRFASLSLTKNVDDADKYHEYVYIYCFEISLSGHRSKC